MKNKLSVLSILLFTCVISYAMEIDKKLAALKSERSEMLYDIEKKAGGNSTIAYRAMLKSNHDKFSKINEDIVLLESLKAKL